MKTLVVVRHAKSSWNDPGMEDFDRPLNDRGKQDAPVMAKRFRQKKIKADLLVSSPAKRALKTAKLFAEELGIDKKDIQLVEQLYLAASHTILDIVTRLDDEKNTVLLFAHNPGLTDFVNSLTHVRIDNLPTCGIYAVSIQTDTWRTFENAEKKFLFFDYPKNPLG